MSSNPTPTGTTGARGWSYGYGSYGRTGYFSRGNPRGGHDFYPHLRGAGAGGGGGSGSTRGAGIDVTDSSRSRGRGFDHRGTIVSRGYGHHSDELPYWNCPDPDCGHRNPGRHHRCNACSLCQPDAEDK